MLKIIEYHIAKLSVCSFLQFGVEIKIYDLWLVSSLTMANRPSREGCISILCHVSDDYAECAPSLQLF